MYSTSYDKNAKRRFKISAESFDFLAVMKDNFGFQLQQYEWDPLSFISSVMIAQIYTFSRFILLVYQNKLFFVVIFEQAANGKSN